MNLLGGLHCNGETLTARLLWADGNPVETGGLPVVMVLLRLPQGSVETIRVAPERVKI